jgi:hypothetical protein
MSVHFPSIKQHSLQREIETASAQERFKIPGKNEEKRETSKKLEEKRKTSKKKEEKREIEDDQHEEHLELVDYMIDGELIQYHESIDIIVNNAKDKGKDDSIRWSQPNLTVRIPKVYASNRDRDILPPCEEAYQLLYINGLVMPERDLFPKYIGDFLDNCENDDKSVHLYIKLCKDQEVFYQRSRLGSDSNITKFSDLVEKWFGGYVTVKVNGRKWANLIDKNFDYKDSLLELCAIGVGGSTPTSNPLKDKNISNRTDILPQSTTTLSTPSNIQSGHVMVQNQKYPKTFQGLVKCIHENFGLAFHDDTFFLKIGHMTISLPTNVDLGDLENLIRNFIPSRLLTSNFEIAKSVSPGNVITVSPVGVGGKKSKTKNSSEPKKMKQASVKLSTLVEALKTVGIDTSKKKKEKEKKTEKKKGVKNKVHPQIDVWAKCYKDAFNPKYRAARLPGDNRLPTDTFFKTGTISIVTPSATTGGSFAVTPNPLTAYIDIQSWLGGASTTSSITMTPYVANTYIWECGSWYTSVNNMRLTSVQWKLRLNIPMNIAVGRLMIAPFPDIVKNFGYTILNNDSIISTSPNGPPCTMLGGYFPAYVNGSNILNLPGSQEFSIIDLVGKDLLLRSKIVSDAVYDFKSVLANNNTTINATQSLSVDTVINSTTGVPVTSDNPDQGRYGYGWTGYFIHFEGVPVSSPIFDVEYIYTFEGQPNIAAVTNDSCVPSTIPSTGGYDRGVIDKALSYASKVNWVEVIEGGATLAYNVLNPKSSSRQMVY